MTQSIKQRGFIIFKGGLDLFKGIDPKEEITLSFEPRYSNITVQGGKTITKEVAYPPVTFEWTVRDLEDYKLQKELIDGLNKVGTVEGIVYIKGRQTMVVGNINIVDRNMLSDDLDSMSSETYRFDGTYKADTTI